MKQHIRLPIPGQRIVRSMVAVWLCFGLYFLRGRHGIPFYSVIAALQCMQPYTREMGKVARKRGIGTLVGAFWGLLVLLLETRLIHEGVPDELPHYLLMGLAVGVVIYSTVVLKVTEASYFSAVVFLSVAVNHIGDANPFLFAFNRVLDTAFGIVIAEVVNRCHLPRLRNRDTLFVSGIGDTILGRDKKLSPYSKVELNRLIQDGAKFTIATTQTQATVRELLPGVDLRYPVITMDGAALYNMKTMEYLRTVPMTQEKAGRLMDWADREGLAFFSNSVQDNLLVVRYRELANRAMETLYERKRLSAYRNFVHSPARDRENVLYLLILDTHPRIEQAYEAFLQQSWAGEYRVVKDVSEYEGFSFLKIYDAAASRPAMLRQLEQLMGTAQTVTFGSIPGKYDVYIANADRDLLVKEVKRRFEPVNLRGWRNMFQRGYQER